MEEFILVLNAGSSSIKFTVFSIDQSAPQAVIKGQVDGIGSRPFFIARDNSQQVIAELFLEGDLVDHRQALNYLLDWLETHLPNGKIIAVGHRVVHGGPNITEPVLVDEPLMDTLESLTPLVPLHQPHNLAGIKAIAKTRSSIPQVACFDTSFHRTCPDITDRFGLPEALYQQGIRRYGFHGLSYEYIAAVMRAKTPEIADKKVIIAHLGNGCSMCAMDGGKSVDTTMSFSALDGLLMGTRCGSLDPGVLLYLMREKKMNVDQLEQLLYKESGLLGISGISNDMRELMASAEPQAQIAVDFFVYRIRRELGSLVAALGGLDALVFTAGIGENSAQIRHRVCEDAKWLGVELDDQLNETNNHELACLSLPESSVSVLVIPTDEELMIAQHTLKLIHARK